MVPSKYDPSDRDDSLIARLRQPLKPLRVKPALPPDDPRWSTNGPRKPSNTDDNPRQADT